MEVPRDLRLLRFGFSLNEGVLGSKVPQEGSKIKG